MTTIVLGWGDVALGAILLALNAAISLALQLGLERQLFISATRMTIQLVLVGLVLKALFATASPWFTGAVVTVMALVAGREIVARQERRLAGWWTYGLGASTMTFGSLAVTLLALTTQLRPEPWFDPRYAVPLFGMMLGNAMTGISLGLSTLLTTVVRDRSAVEARLMLGATRWEGCRGVVRQALRAGLMPTINAMSATGLVFLPGMMTGQILAGVEPTLAVRYQLLVMFLIAGATGSGVLLAVMGGVWRVTDERHRLRLDRLVGGERTSI